MLEIQTFDIYTLMEHFHRPTIQYGYHCRGCNTENSTEKTITIIALPNVLVIQLSRFRGLEKIEKYVRFPTQISIRYNIDGNEYNTQYRIMGIIVHIGTSIQAGHYIAFIRAGEKWFKMNDHIVSAVQWQTVRTKKAYILFYDH